MIFDLCLEGYGTSQIARILKDRKILTPFSYWNSKGQAFKCSENPYNWYADTVARIIEKKEYLEHTVNFKTYKQSYKSKKKSPQRKNFLQNAKTVSMNWTGFSRTFMRIKSKEF